MGHLSHVSNNEERGSFLFFLHPLIPCIDANYSSGSFIYIIKNRLVNQGTYQLIRTYKVTNFKANINLVIVEVKFQQVLSEGASSIDCTLHCWAVGQCHANKCLVKIPLGEVYKSLLTNLLGMSSANVGKHPQGFLARFSLGQKISKGYKKMILNS